MYIPSRIVIGSRESRLAVIQSSLLENWIRKTYPQMKVSMITMKTTGDKILDRSLSKIGGKGLFVKELDAALRDGRCDLCVHSFKDIPMELPEDMVIAACSKREDPRDVLVVRQGAKDKEKLIIGTGSPRRVLQIKTLYPDAETENIRGNIQTRLRKLDEGRYDAVVLAAAGLKRLGFEHRISRYFETGEMIPAAGQGVLAVQGLAGRDYSWLAGFNDKAAHSEVTAERAFVRSLGGGCSSPVAAYAKVNGETIYLTGLYYDEERKAQKICSVTGSALDPEGTGNQLAREICFKS